MKNVRCPICKQLLTKRSKSFPFCAARCKLLHTGNWLEDTYRIEADRLDPIWG